jgi:hypothetical protein
MTLEDIKRRLQHDLILRGKDSELLIRVAEAAKHAVEDWERSGTYELRLALAALEDEPTKDQLILESEWTSRGEDAT